MIGLIGNGNSVNLFLYLRAICPAVCGQCRGNLRQWGSCKLRNFGTSFRPREWAEQGTHSEREHHMKRSILKFWNDESGATAIEYGLIAAGISLAIIAVVNGLGTNLNEKFTSINTSLK